MTRCEICPNRCYIEEGDRGSCGARICRDGEIVCENYGKITSIALDPIEKKPFARFCPGSMILSIGSYGCNLRCLFCQNSGISAARDGCLPYRNMTPEAVASMADTMRSAGNIGVAYTYNEPVISYEFVRDTAFAVRDRNLKNVLVTNGMILPEPLMGLLPQIDAVNVDLKAFNNDFYRWVGGDMKTAMDTIAIAWKCGCHVEVTTLIIPGKNDSPEEMSREAAWLASVSDEIPLHITRYFPHYRTKDIPATPVKTVNSLVETARESLKFVYPGNCPEKKEAADHEY